jgi:uncharacterized protein YqgC (DUF456 family)
MDIALIILWIFLIILWLIGSVAPILPGPPISFLGLLVLHWAAWIQFSSTLLWTLWILTAITLILDYTIPQRGTKKFGGTKYGTRWSTIWLIAGLFFFPPMGLILWPIVWAFLGEYLHTNDKKHAFRSARWSLVGFVLGVWIKLIVCGIILWYGITTIF